MNLKNLTNQKKKQLKKLKGNNEWRRIKGSGRLCPTIQDIDGYNKKCILKFTNTILWRSKFNIKHKKNSFFFQRFGGVL